MPATTRMAARTIGELAATLPGASDVFREFRFDFCCMLEQTLESVAEQHDTPTAPVIAALEALRPTEDATRPHALEPLIGHILARYHMVHRSELPKLIDCAEMVERRHHGHPDVPFGLAGVLRELADALDQHMAREELELFPRLRRVEPGSGLALQEFRLEHARLEAYLCCLETLTAGHRPPADACADWRRLYAGTKKLVDDLIRHRFLESESLDQCWRQGAHPMVLAPSAPGLH
jgi:regulator of cell morphogenesis and NO signaling